MQRSLRNTSSVLAVTALTAMAVFAGVQVSARVLGDVDDSAGYSASAYASECVSDDEAQAGPLVCPATGCTASSCHATTGRAPGH